MSGLALKAAATKTQQSFVIKTRDGKPIGQLTIFYTDDTCTGGQIHLNSGGHDERYAVFLKPAQTTYRGGNK